MKTGLIIIFTALALAHYAHGMDDHSMFFEAWKQRYWRIVEQEEAPLPGVACYESIFQQYKPWMAVSLARHIVERSHGNDLHFFAHVNEPQILAYLLQKNSPDLANVNGRTPLHIAAEEGHAEALQCLLENQASPDVQDNCGETPLHRLAQLYPRFHASGNWLSCLHRLMRFKANVLIVNNAKKTALDIAAKRGILQLKKALISATVD